VVGKARDRATYGTRGEEGDMTIEVRKVESVKATGNDA